MRGSKKDAQAALANLVTRIQTGTELDPSRVTVAEYFDRWLTHSRTRIRPTTWNRYEGLVRLHVLPQIGTLRLSKLRPAHVSGCARPDERRGCRSALRRPVLSRPLRRDASGAPLAAGRHEPR